VALIHVSRMDSMGSDLTVANAARVSFAKHKKGGRSSRDTRGGTIYK
jgi:hypothetical protein